ncbi:Glycosyltransferase involved in cell wall bisynthesis [Cetobacterium ceti]|uniref:Glycosyltransferase involved in cell wall bisynthesis n=1 Tax=Cetobacterium ceti TaxID=180163 RepID=A0A1T4LT13_9FUSO|nr:glycosyltransferase [Cetobacterium ceti]SJZ57797.1 Glycosyltransferase involved in cell wall bisynthesis [Cetobacterium ceti]
MKIVLYFDLFGSKYENIYQYKDIYQFPKKLKNILNGNLELNFYSKNEENKFFFIENNKTNISNNIFNFLMTLFLQRKKTDICILFHVRLITFCLFIIYKLGNKNNKAFLKGDVNLKYLKDIYSNKFFFKGYLYRYLIRKTDIFFVETKECYEFLKEKKLNNIEIYSNNFDNNLLSEMNIVKKEYSQKKNIILHVSRVGTYPKNTELLLEILENIELNNWEVYILGKIEENFKLKISEFFDKNPHLIENIKFLGQITDKKKVYEYYNESKIYLCTSRYEGFSIAFTEVLIFNNYIITTNVSGAKDITNNNELGYICKREEDFIKKINILLKDEEQISKLDKKREEYIKKIFSTKHIEDKLKEII